MTKRFPSCFLKKGGLANTTKGPMIWVSNAYSPTLPSRCSRFRKMNRQSGSPQNDRAIFSSITSLMKAQSYELDALLRRKTVSSVYQFNLVNVVDTELIRLFFEKTSHEATAVDEEHYIARYIVNKRDTFARIHFVCASKFETALKEYDRLHSANCKIFSGSCDEFYESVLSDGKRTQVFMEEFGQEIRQTLWIRLLRSSLHLDAKLEGTWLYWRNKESLVEVMVPVSEEAIDFLNEDTKAKRAVADALAKWYRYTGPFRFAIDDVPF